MAGDAGNRWVNAPYNVISSDSEVNRQADDIYRSITGKSAKELLDEQGQQRDQARLDSLYEISGIPYTMRDGRIMIVDPNTGIVLGIKHQDGKLSLYLSDDLNGK